VGTPMGISDMTSLSTALMVAEGVAFASSALVLWLSFLFL
jgi:hypothetical protein